MPSSIEHLLQLIGRAGRDKKESYVHIFLNDEDYFIQRNMIYMENIDAIPRLNVPQKSIRTNGFLL